MEKVTFGGWISLVILVIGTASETQYPKDAEIFYQEIPVGNDIFHYKLTNGHVMIDAVASKRIGIVSCDVKTGGYYGEKTINSIETVRTSGKIENTDIEDIIAVCRDVRNKMLTPKFKRDGASTTTQPTISTTSNARGKWNSILVEPGTKWCGSGNNALDYNDLGEHNYTDSCCRDHDHCKVFIPSSEEGHHYHNKYPWTLSSCGCDTNFFNCLQSIGNNASLSVGKSYFDLLEVPCFNIETGKYCVKYHWSKLWCVVWKIGEKATLNFSFTRTYEELHERKIQIENNMVSTTAIP